VEEVPTGWLAAYGDPVTDATGETEIRSYPVTNVLDTGELKVKKNWLANDPGNATSVTVELWRQAYDGDEPYIPPAEVGQQQTQGSRRLTGNLFSMRRVQTALAETQTDYSKVQTEVVEEAPVPNVSYKPRLTISSGQMALAAANEEYKELSNITPNTEIDLRSLLSGIEVTRIETSSDGGGQFKLGYIETSYVETNQSQGTGFTYGVDEYIQDITIDSSCSNVKVTLSNYYQTNFNDVQFYDENENTWISLNDTPNTILSMGEHDCSSLISGKTISKVKYVLQTGGGYNGYANLSWIQTVEQNSQKDKTYQYDTGVSSFADVVNPIQWGNLINQWNGSNPCNLQWVRFYYIPTGPTVTIQDKPTGVVNVISGDTTSLSATTTGGTISWSSSDNDVATVDSNGNITFKQVSAATNVTITASATDAGTTNSDSVTYTVTPFSITDKANIATNQTEGNTVDLDANASASWSSSDTTVETVATVDANGVVTFTGNGTVAITATHGGATDTISFTVSSLGFTPTVTPGTVHVGGTATLGADLAGVTWAIKPTGNTGTAELTGNTVTATGVGDVTLIGTRGSVTQEVTLHIASMKVTYNNEDIIPDILTVNVRSSIPVVNVVGTSSGQTTDDQIAVYDPATRTVTVGEKVGEATITITDEGGGSLTFKVKTEVTEASANIPSTAEKVQDITISTTANWLSSAVSGLPKTDGLGHTYRYFIKEEATGAFIPVAYSTSGQGAELSDTLTQLSLTNASQQSESTTLPESGSTGTRIYYLSGAMLLLLAAAGYATYSIKRRRWYDE
jgi:hypothetical protein